YYTAVGLADDRHRRFSAAGIALAALALDPFYKTKLKLGLLLRSGLGEGAFGRISHTLHARVPHETRGI
ncbi:MAG TPA: hypothetical protein VFH60_00010, partial [Chloroflexia bacterium]|nr:hypothetical protein [Chloroflexia bacterium]